jgi:hypothetical protein
VALPDQEGHPEKRTPLKLSEFRRAFFEIGEAVMSSEPICRICGRCMRVLKGRTVSFWACDHFPWCPGTKDMTTKEQRRVRKKRTD